VRLRHLRQLRMSRQDLRGDARERRRPAGEGQAEADPARPVAAAHAGGAVRKAAVVVTNPTHYAVALGYERGSSAAPRVLAKGVDAMAARIRAEAEAHGVPVVANPPLARALHRLELEAAIPAEHYQAVAEIIARLALKRSDWRRQRAPYAGKINT
jgi:flagellar biosynthetic protein FlhB